MFKVLRFFSTEMKDNCNYLPNLEPVLRYLNTDIDKANILTDNRNKIGIYRWINNLNKKTYIGSSNNLSVRFYKYYSLRYLAKSNRPMERALLKYGFSNFTLEILEYCNLNNLLEREQYYLNNLKPDYNIVETAGSTLGYKHTEESLKKMRDFILSDEVLARKRLATKNAASSNRISILVENIKTRELCEYKSLTDASYALKVSRAAVSQALLNNRMLRKVYKIIRKI
jgi:hypothetical protein